MDDGGRSRLQRTQEEVEEVKVIMLDNMNKADERAGKLSDLDDRAEELLKQGKVFEKKAQKVKEKKMWENKKMKIILIVAGVVAFVVVLGLVLGLAL
ncbi:vesicle-associated membrane protein 5 [Salarias fasciatus]|uniref:vesicle-associated membrane protein 5 n=1 Tax=Salarias fasciatus TaxID=181472 RepID=UPI001177015C|nr:vesicle-associated membrane protein 1-like [Salarias fasciatus]